MRHSLVFLPLILLMGAGLASCRTTSTPSATKATQDTKVGAALELSKTEEQDLYLKMLQVELDAGTKVPKEQLHTTSGLIACRKANTQEACDLHVRLMNDELSASQPLSKEISSKAWRFMRSARAELAEEQNAILDLSCNYIGKKSPPYTIEDVRCGMLYPRSSNEAVFVGRLAEDIVELMRGQSALGAQQTILHGTLACQWLGVTRHPACVVRIIEKGVLQESIQELPQRITPQIARRLQLTLVDHLQRKAAAKRQPALAPPSEVIGSLQCIVDTEETKRTVFCRASI